jgi:hypothetical protein
MVVLLSVLGILILLHHPRQVVITRCRLCSQSVLTWYLLHLGLIVRLLIVIKRLLIGILSPLLSHLIGRTSIRFYSVIILCHTYVRRHYDHLFVRGLHTLMMTRWELQGVHHRLSSVRRRD